MPVISAYPNGSTAGTPPGKNDHERAKRGLVRGWSQAAVRRHTKWLYSIDGDQLASSSRGWALTLTMRDCPPDSETFTRLRGAWLKRMERHGVDLSHWVVEWQARRVPHMHCAIYESIPVLHALDDDGAAVAAPQGIGAGPAPEGSDAAAEPKEVPDGAGLRPGMEGLDLGTVALLEWIDVAGPYGATWSGQDVKPIEGAMGWLKYLSKHAARGVRHYQRQGMPPGWEKTGRLWGKGGAWPEIAPVRLQMSQPAFHRYRRLVRSWRVADARASGDPRRISAARRMLASSDPKLSAVRGVSEWTAQPIILDLIGLLADEGHLILQEDNA